MDNALFELLAATIQNNTAKRNHDIKAGKDPKFVQKEAEIRVGQALNAAFALDAASGKPRNTVQIMEDSIYFESIILLRHSLSMDELKEFLESVQKLEGSK
jgi:hypothetical protein